MTETKRPYRSVSQVNSYKKCPYAYFLERIEKVWQKPAAWLPQGTAVHEALEMWEKSGRKMTVEEAQDVFRESYSKAVSVYTEKTPRFDYWFWSGPYDGETDVERRYGLGLEQVPRLIEWYDKHPDEVIWISEDGTPGIELSFNITLGDVPVRGYIDAIIVNKHGNLVVRDIKTGNQPGDDFQLAVYAEAMEQQYGTERPRTGDYFMGRTGRPTQPYMLSDWTTEALTEEFTTVDNEIRKGNFPAKPDSDKCNFCSVKASCDFRA